MGYELKMPKPLRDQGWKIKIRDRERTEHPHVTIIRGTQAWRYDIRNDRFMDREPDPKDVPDAVVSLIGQRMKELREHWDRLYPANPVSQSEGDDE